MNKLPTLSDHLIKECIRQQKTKKETIRDIDKIIVSYLTLFTERLQQQVIQGELPLSDVEKLSINLVGLIEAKK